MEAFVKQTSVIARILCGPGQVVAPIFRLRPKGLRRDKPRSLEKSRGRAGRQGPDGPADLDASQHRGALKSEPQVRRYQGVPRAMFIGLLRLAPGGLTFSGNPPLLAN
jgi:hypothetical protein